MVKYDPLHRHLDAQPASATTVRMTFGDVARLVGELPESAWEHRPWWANDRTHVQAQAWLEAGWEVDSVDQSAGNVVFRRV